MGDSYGKKQPFSVAACFKNEMNLFNLWFDDSFWGTQSVFFFFIKNSSHWQTDIYDLNCLSKHR